MLSQNDRVSLGQLPINEIYGPVLEGEGPFAGTPVVFVRFCYCDFKCTWCDSMYAVTPEPQTIQWMYAGKILACIEDLLPRGSWVSLTGGNPGLYDLGTLIIALHTAGYKVRMETQGSIWKNWMDILDYIVWSPKPPSAQMVDRAKLYFRFWSKLCRGREPRTWCLKVPVFDELDYAFFKLMVSKYVPWGHTAYLSIGTDKEDTRDSLAETYQEFVEIVLGDLSWFAKEQVDVSVLPQIHVFGYLHKRGV